MKVAVTGGTGMLGINLIKKLIKKDYEVLCLVRKESNKEFLEDCKVKLIVGDLTQPETLIPLVREAQRCFHLAAQVADVGPSEIFDKVNVDGTRNLCETILQYNPSCKLIYASTIVVFNFDLKKKRESTNYAISKYKAEKVVWDYIQNKNLIGTIIYPGMIYGPYDMRFIPSFIKYLKAKKVVYITGGESLAPLIYVDDLCDLFIKASEQDCANGRSYISIKGLDIGMHDFINMIADKTGYPRPKYTIPRSVMMILAIFLESIYNLFKIKTRPPLTKRMVDVLSIHGNFDTSKSWEELEWAPKTKIEEGLELTFKWYEEQKVLDGIILSSHRS